MIRFPEALKIQITMALGTDFLARIKREKVIAVLSFRQDDGVVLYHFEIRSKDNKRVYLAMNGTEDDADQDGNVPLEPVIGRVSEKLGDKVDIGDGCFFVRRISINESNCSRFRLEFKPLNSSAVYLALEGIGQEGQGIRMLPAETHPGN